MASRTARTVAWRCSRHSGGARGERPNIRPVPALPSWAVGYPRSQSAPPTSPLVEAQKREREAYAPRDALAADPASEGLALLKVSRFPVPSAWSVLWPEGKRLSPLAVEFVRHLREASAGWEAHT